MAPRVVADRYVLAPTPPIVGGLASVYHATDAAHPGTEVAVKLIRQSSDTSGLIDLFFEREVAALRTLDHPNIVRLFDAGVDPQSGEYYLVLEWIPETLEGVLAIRTVPSSWDEFADGLGLPIVRGLAHAHERRVVHRDVKPSNVLVAAGVPKLCDFGISKLKAQLTDDHRTVGRFGSIPYSPPEQESSSAYSRDVFSFGVLALQCLAKEALKDLRDVQRALANTDPPAEVADLLARCIDVDPANRPNDGRVLLAELEALQRERNQENAANPTVYAHLTFRAESEVADAAGEDGAEAARRVVAGDLAGEVRARVFDRDESGQLLVFGERWSFRAADDQPPQLALMTARLQPPNRQDVDRDQAAPLALEFALAQPLNYATAAASLRLIRDQIRSWEEERADEAIRREDARLFEQWGRQLSAKEAIDERREPALAYQKVRVQGQRLDFSLEAEPIAELVGQRRVIRRDANSTSILAGEVFSVQGRQLVLYADRPLRSAPPPRGMLDFDIHASQVAIGRQRAVLNALRYRSADLSRPDMPKLILDPASADPGVPIAIERWFTRDIDEGKKEAVQAALGARDCFVVEGPPGTGKTTFIAELVAQVLEREPQARVLIASQTNVALDNALEILDSGESSRRIVRLGPNAGSAEGRIADSVRHLTLDAQRDRWITDVRGKSEVFIQELARDRGADIRLVKAALRIGELLESKARLARTQALAAELRAQTQITGGDADEGGLSDVERQAVDDQLAELAEGQRTESRVQKLAAEQIADLMGPGFAAREIESLDDALLESLADDCFPSGATDQELRALVLLHGRWLTRIGRGSEFDEALLFSSQVVGATCIGLAGVVAARDLPFDLCIVDEASKATATEALVPLARSRRWVLVGDKWQLPPFQDDALGDDDIVEEFALDEQELRRTLFDRLLDALPKACRAMLRMQHRMVGPIGKLISDCFYRGELDNSEAPGFGFAAILPRPVTWYTTHQLPDRDESRVRVRGSVSVANGTEAGEVLRRLRQINDRLASPWTVGVRPPGPIHVLVLSPYRAQVAEIERRLAPHRGSLPHLQIEVNSVDAAQGRQAEIVILSLARSNRTGDLGFLLSDSRINVALSRARQGLLIVGDAELCESTPGPLARVLEYIRRQPEMDCAIEAART